MKRLYEDDILNDTIPYAYYHFAVLDTDELPLLVSCVTLEPPHKVPPGKQFAVSSIRQYSISSHLHIYLPHLFQPGINLRLKEVSYVYVFVSNKNEESAYFCD